MGSTTKCESAIGQEDRCTLQRLAPDAGSIHLQGGRPGRAPDLRPHLGVPRERPHLPGCSNWREGRGSRETPRKSPRKSQQTWAAGKGEFLQKVTLFYIPSLCTRPARVSMKDPYSSPSGTTQTAAAIVEGGPRGPGEKAARFPDFPFPYGFLMFVQGL